MATTAPAQTGSVASDVTVTGTISVSEASSVLGTTYHILDDVSIIAEALVAQGYRTAWTSLLYHGEEEAAIIGRPRSRSFLMVCLKATFESRVYRLLRKRTMDYNGLLVFPQLHWYVSSGR